MVAGDDEAYCLQMRIGQRRIGSGPEQSGPYIIAELGVNHDGSAERAMTLVEAAHAAGADAVKLQVFDAAELLSSAAMPAEYQLEAGLSDPRQMLQRLQLDMEQMRAVFDCARELGLHCIATIFNLGLVQDAQELGSDAYKTASPDIVNRPLIDALKETGRPLIVSAGGATLEEVAQATQWLGDHPHVLMQCVSAYPTPAQHAHLAGRLAMLAVNANALGYSDHTTATDTGALAVASGACVLEKHLTYSREATGPDHAASLDPEGFAEYVRLARRAWAMLGNHEKKVLPIEEDVRRVSRQSLVTLRALPAGHEITADDLTIKRPGTGISPGELSRVIGRVTIRSVDADVPLVEDDLR